MPPIRSRRLAFPKIVHPEAPPVRPERHVANSIATIRRHLIVALATTLARCPCCNAPRKTTDAYPILLRSKSRCLRFFPFCHGAEPQRPIDRRPVHPHRGGHVLYRGVRVLKQLTGMG